MKTAALFALVATAFGDDAAPATTADASDNSYGYEAPQEQATYQPEPEHYEHYEAAPRVCVVCDKFAPCWNGVSCSARSFESEGAYATQGQVQTIAGGYRRLAEDASYGQEAQGQEYGAESYGAEAPRAPTGGSCPCGTIDTTDYRVNNTIILWVAFFLLFVPGLWYLCKAFDDWQDGVNDEWGNLRVGSGIINLVASLAYLTMALGYGYTTKCNGRDFYYARYVDWAITTPIMLWDLVTIADGTHSHEVDRIFLVVIDFIMIIAGLVGELIDGTEKWAFFGFSMLLFVPIMWFLCELANTTVANGESRTPVQELFRRIAAITIISWMGYPIIWVLASVHGSSSSCHVGGYATEAVGYGAQATQEAGYRMLQNGAAGSATKMGIITVQGEAYAYTVLDIIAKTLMGWVIVCFQPTANPPMCNPAKAIIINAAIIHKNRPKN